MLESIMKAPVLDPTVAQTKTSVAAAPDTVTPEHSPTPVPVLEEEDVRQPEESAAEQLTKGTDALFQKQKSYYHRKSSRS